LAAVIFSNGAVVGKANALPDAHNQHFGPILKTNGLRYGTLGRLLKN
jgi:hypothetical protein